MSDFFFAVTRKPVAARTAAKRDRIARRVGGPRCGYVTTKQPDGPHSWGYAPNLGAPFDRATAAAIQAAWAKEGVG